MLHLIEKTPSSPLGTAAQSVSALDRIARGNIRLLLIEDDPDDAMQIYRLRAYSAGFLIEHEAKLARALERLRMESFDVVLLDLTLPGSTGWETFSRVFAAVPNLPVIILSGSDDVEMAIRSVQCGAQDYLVKGHVNNELLARSIRYAIERKRTEETLKAERNLLRSFIESLPEAVYVKDTSGCYVMDNAAHRRRLGVEREEEIIGRTIFDFYPAEIAVQFDMDDQLIMQTHKAVVDRVEIVKIKNRDESRWLATTKIPLHDGHDKIIGLACVSRDITESRRLEGQILEISEREQRRIGQDLHDGLCQRLAATAFASGILEQQLGQKGMPEETASVREITGMIHASIREARDIAHGLDPVDLAENALICALRELAVNIERNFKIPCSFQCDDPKPMMIRDHKVAVNLYRICQEALNNAIKHSGATRLEISARCEGDKLIVSVVDDGCSFHIDAAPSKGLGMHTMRYRAHMIGADLRIENGSNGNSGVRVICELPHACLLCNSNETHALSHDDVQLQIDAR